MIQKRKLLRENRTFRSNTVLSGQRKNILPRRFNLLKNEQKYDYLEVTNKEFEDWVDLGMKLWPKNLKEDLREIFVQVLNSKNQKAYICKNKKTAQNIGFVEVSIHDEQGDDPHCTCYGQVNHIYIKPEYQAHKNNIAQNLIRMGKDWAYANGCEKFIFDHDALDITI